MRDVALRGVHERRGVEMPVMMLDEPGDRPAREFCRLFPAHDDKITAVTIRSSPTIANAKLAETT
jgi:hypothetical protein